MPTNNDIKRYMRNNLSDHIDGITGEVNMTSLAEDAAAHFDANIPDIDELYFELSYEIACEFESGDNE